MQGDIYKQYKTGRSNRILVIFPKLNKQKYTENPSPFFIPSP